MIKLLLKSESMYQHRSTIFFLFSESDEVVKSSCSVAFLGNVCTPLTNASCKFYHIVQVIFLTDIDVVIIK